MPADPRCSSVPPTRATRAESAGEVLLARVGQQLPSEWAVDAFRVKRHRDEALIKGTPQAVSIRESEIARSPSNKLIQADWVWHANRPSSSKRTAWHRAGQTLRQRPVRGLPWRTSGFPRRWIIG